MTKWILGLVLVFASAVSGAEFNVPDVQDHMPIVIGSPIDADVYIWSVSSPARRITIDNGKTIHVWAPPGTYDVGLTTIKIDWEKRTVAYDEHRDTFKVGDKPGPGPDPDPEPDPEPTGFSADIKAAYLNVPQAARTKAFDLILPDGNTIQTTANMAIAEVYAGIADEAGSNPAAWDAAAMVNESKVRIASDLPSSVLSGWTAFWPQLSKAFVKSGLKANDLNGHIKAFNDIADVLEE